MHGDSQQDDLCASIREDALVDPVWPDRVVDSAVGSVWTSLPVSLRRLSYRILRWIGVKLYGAPPFPCTQRLPFGLYCKFGMAVRASEAWAMTFVRANTDIPVPRVLDVLDWDGRIFILMTQLPGQPLQSGAKSMTPEELDELVTDLRHWFSQLRRLRPPSLMISGLMGLPLEQFRLSETDKLGPFANEDDLYEWIFSRIPADATREIKALMQARPSQPRVCFSHGDVHPSNLLVLNNRLCGLVDWGSCGWYPEYWDYTGACYTFKRRNYTAWMQVWSRIFPHYQRELDIQGIVSRTLFPY